MCWLKLLKQQLLRPLVAQWLSPIPYILIPCHPGDNCMSYPCCHTPLFLSGLTLTLSLSNKRQKRRIIKNNFNHICSYSSIKLLYVARDQPETCLNCRTVSCIFLWHFYTYIKEILSSLFQFQQYKHFINFSSSQSFLFLIHT